MHLAGRDCGGPASRRYSSALKPQDPTALTAARLRPSSEDRTMKLVCCRMALRFHTTGAQRSGNSRTVGAAPRSTVVQSGRAKPTYVGFLCAWVALAALPVQSAIVAPRARALRVR